MTRSYFRPIPNADAARPREALPIAGGPSWFTHAQHLQRSAAPEVIPANEIPWDWRDRITAPRSPICGIAMDQMRLMGVLNVTPDSFSDGGAFAALDTALTQARAMLASGCDILDIGGESTRPGADFVNEEAEIARVLPVIKALRDEGISTPISIDTRKAAVARAAVAAGAGLFNDVSALEFDSASMAAAAMLKVPVCLMHAQGLPETMQDNPQYGDVLLEVYDYLEARVAACEAAGILRQNILVDPGIGFGKTLAHNLELLRGMSVFHGLGCPILLGVSRKRFIGELAEVPDAQARFPGSMAVALDGARQGVQVIRVHDMAQTRQALTLWQGCVGQK